MSGQPLVAAGGQILLTANIELPSPGCAASASTTSWQNSAPEPLGH
jgi:hypothetical protein